MKGVKMFIDKDLSCGTEFVVYVTSVINSKVKRFWK